jgi:ferredoxin
MTTGREIRIWLEPDTCTGHARCHAVASSLFPIDEEGYSALLPTCVPAEQLALAREGADACPERAIVIED